MKISPKIPSIGAQESSEKEIQGQQKSKYTKSETASPVDKFEGPDSVNRDPLPLHGPDSTSSNQNDKVEGTRRSPILSTADRYKGPDSLQLPQIVSKVDAYKGPDSIQRPEIKSPVSKYEGPKSLSPELKHESRVEQLIGHDKNSRRHLTQEPSIPALPGRGGHTSSGSGLLGNVASAVSGLPSDPQNSRSSRVNQYEGPNSLPLRESRVDHYKGPDSIELPKRESPVNNYKGPNSVELPKRESPVTQYQGPDSITPPRTRPHVDLTVPDKKKRGYSQSSETSVPDIPSGIGQTSSGNGLLGNAGAAGSGFSSEPEISRARTSADRYKGADSLKRAEIESEVEKYKGPKSLVEERDSSAKKYIDSLEQRIENSNEETAGSKYGRGMFPSSATRLNRLKYEAAHYFQKPADTSDNVTSKKTSTKDDDV